MINRRGFLSRSLLTTTGLGGLAAAFAPMPARAWSIQQCNTRSINPACREIARHATLLTELHASLAKHGYNEAQQQAILSHAICPVCGQLLIG